MYPFGREQEGPVGPSWRASPEDQVMAGSSGEEPLLLPLSSRGLSRPHHHRAAPERRDGETYELCCMFSLLFAVVSACVVGSVLALAAVLPGDYATETVAATHRPLEVPFLDFKRVPDARPRPPIITAAPPPSVGGRPISGFTRGKLFYRSAYLDEAGGHLFVGAMDHLFKLRLDDISRMPITELHLPAPQSSVARCTALGGGPLGTAVECSNHIRVVQPIRNGSTLYVCGTNSRNPTDWQVQAADLSIVPEAQRVPVMESNQTGKAAGRCSDFVSRNTSSLWLDDAPVPGTSCVVSLWHLPQGRHAIYRAAIPEPGTGRTRHSFLRTDDADASVLNEPHSVGALSFGAHAYFVFREKAAERRACGVQVVSGMARVCKNDLGGDPGTGRRAQLWTSYTKVRLGCTDFTEFPDETGKAHFTFEAIYASSWVPNLENGVLFGAYTTVTHGFPDSAVCAFRREDIERAFNGTRFFQVSLSRDTLSKVVSSSQANYTGRGAACVVDSRTLDPTETNFLLSHPLLAESPKQRHSRVFYTLPGVEFSAMAAFVFSESWGSWVICYVATANGLVVKLAEEIVPGGRTPAPAQQVDVFVGSTVAIRKLLVSLKHRSLYVFSDYDILQFRMDDCGERPPECPSCVMDPFCGWDGARCVPHVDGTTRRVC
ncbi:semaphorin-2A-like [Amblyomma americanum]